MREVMYCEKVLDYSVKVMEHRYRMALLEAPEAKRPKTGVPMATQYDPMCGDDRPPLKWFIEEHCEQSPHARGPIRRFLEDFKVATGVNDVTMEWLKEAMQEEGFKKKKLENNNRENKRAMVFVGIASKYQKMD
jgi:hypothetical protein